MTRFLLPSLFCINIFLLNAQEYKSNKPGSFAGAGDPCTNMDFEECSFNGWELYKGDIPGTAQYSFSNISPVSPDTFHFITSGGIDQVILASNPADSVSRVFSDGNCSVLLGDGTSTGAKGAMIKQTFLVDSINTLISFRYAVILQDPAHPQKEQPYFRVRAYDSTGSSVPCGEYNVIGGPATSGGDPDFIAASYNGETLYYKNWTSEFIDLSGYTGQNITLDFIVGDCSQGGHFGYAYIDGLCGSGDEDGITMNYINGCSSFPVELTAMGGQNYQWNSGDTVQTISVDSNGTYSVTVTSGFGCTKNFSITVNISDSSFISPGFTFEASCAGNPANFYDLSASSGTVTGWSWNFDDSSAGSYLQHPQHIFDSSGVYNVKLTITTNEGCARDTTIPVSINENTMAMISAPDSVCFSDVNYIFTANDSGGTWFGNGITDTLLGVFNPMSAGIGSHGIRYVNPLNCIDSTIHFVTVIESPTLFVDTIVNVTCFGGNDGSFQLSASGGSSPYTLVWGNGCLSCLPFNLVAGNYPMLVYDTQGCRDSINIEISQPSQLGINIIAPSVVLCEGDSTVISVFATGGIFPYNFLWTTGDTGQSIIAIASQLYKVTVVDANGCSGSVSATLGFYPNPEVNLGNDTSIIDNDSLVLDAGFPGSNHVWSTGDTAQIITVFNAGAYYVSVTDSNSCAGADTIVVSVILYNPGNDFSDSRLPVYPNPADRFIYVNFELEEPPGVLLMNMLGEEVLHTQILSQQSQLFVGDLPRGIYLLRVFTKDRNQSLKIILH